MNEWMNSIGSLEFTCFTIQTNLLNVDYLSATIQRCINVYLISDFILSFYVILCSHRSFIKRLTQNSVFRHFCVSSCNRINYIVHWKRILNVNMHIAFVCVYFYLRRIGLTIFYHFPTTNSFEILCWHTKRHHIIQCSARMLR